MEHAAAMQFPNAVQACRHNKCTFKHCRDSLGWALQGYSAVWRTGGQFWQCFWYPAVRRCWDTLRLGTTRILLVVIPCGWAAGILHCKDYTSVGYSAVAHGTEGKQNIEVLKSNNSTVWVENFRVFPGLFVLGLLVEFVMAGLIS